MQKKGPTKILAIKEMMLPVFLNSCSTRCVAVRRIDNIHKIGSYCLSCRTNSNMNIVLGRKLHHKTIQIEYY